MSPKNNRKRRWLAPAAWLAGIGSAVLLTLAVNGTLASFTAQITNTDNNAASGTLIMTETDGTTTCKSNDVDQTGDSSVSEVTLNESNCTINKFGGSVNLAPGVASTPVNITIKNDGTLNAGTFTLQGGTCTQSNNTATDPYHGTATDMCSKVNVVITGPGPTTIYSGPINGITSTPISINGGTLAAGASYAMTFTATLDASADNSYQGLKVSMPLIWKFAQ